MTRSTKNPLRKEYKRNLRREWYPLLNSLDEIFRQKHASAGVETMTACAEIRRVWQQMGAVGMGLDEEKERKDYEIRAVKLCSWRECQWHTDEPSDALKTCTGCGEAVHSRC